jgi:hypothetical protein
VSPTSHAQPLVGARDTAPEHALTADLGAMARLIAFAETAAAPHRHRFT